MFCQRCSKDKNDGGDLPHWWTASASSCLLFLNSPETVCLAQLSAFSSYHPPSENDWEGLLHCSIRGWNSYEYVFSTLTRLYLRSNFWLIKSLLGGWSGAATPLFLRQLTPLSFIKSLSSVLSVFFKIHGFQMDFLSFLDKQITTIEYAFLCLKAWIGDKCLMLLCMLCWLNVILLRSVTT